MKVRINFFATLSAEIDGQVINLEDVLGKQLSELFGLFVLNRGNIITKEKFINTLWQDSDNPLNALKYAIHRLRNSLKEIAYFKDMEVIETAKSGYKLNDALEIETDYELFMSGCEKTMKTHELADYKYVLDLYKGDFLASGESDWIYLERAHFKIELINIAEMMSKKCLELEDYSECLNVCRIALDYDDFNEELIYAYIKALIETKQYNEALKYYESASSRMNKELGVNLQDKTNSLLSIFNAKIENSSKADLDDFQESLYDNYDVKGPMLCDYATFKKITQYEIRTCIRNNRNKYLIFICFADDNTNVNALMNVVASTLRIDDVYTQVSGTQIAVLCSLRQNSDAYIVGERIISKYYRKVDSKARLVYKLKVLTDEHIAKHKNSSLFVV